MQNRFFPHPLFSSSRLEPPQVASSLPMANSRTLKKRSRKLEDSKAERLVTRLDSSEIIFLLWIHSSLCIFLDSAPYLSISIRILQ